MVEVLQALAIQNTITFKDDQFQQCFPEGKVLVAVCCFCFILFSLTMLIK